MVVAVFGLLVLSGVLSAQGRSEDALEHVKDVQERNTNRLMAMNGVEGTAIGYNQNDRLAIKVFTAGPGVRGIPRELEGVPVQVVVTGKIYALVDPTDRFPRPVPTGVSTGHPDITAGTIACRVTDGDNVYALSNNHVYANSNKATIGDNVLQPGTADGGVDPDDAIGTLFDFEPIVFHPRARNTIDAAIALSDTDNLGNATPDGGYGTPSSTIFEGDLLDLGVQKYGRTTKLTKGVITGVNVTVRVGYSRGTARFVKQIMVESGTEFIGGGDSGSLLVTDDTDCNPVGLLFAGNGSGTMAIANRINLVLQRFGVTVDDSEGPVDNPPTVDITNPSDGATVSSTITIEADASDDVGVMQVDFYIDGALLATDTEAPYSCSWDSGMVADGSHTITAKATDTIEQTTTSAAITVTVDNINDPPVADAGSDQSALVGETVTFDGSSSDDPDGTITSYEWDFDDGTTGSGITTTHDYLIVGTYTVILTVTDNDGLTDTDEVIITVTEAGAETSMHVGDLDGVKDIKGKSGNWEVFVTVTIHDDNHDLVANATVTGEWSGATSGTVSGTTGSDGTVTFTTGTMKGGTIVTFIVNNVTHATLSYDISANHETIITVTK